MARIAYVGARLVERHRLALAHILIEIGERLNPLTSASAQQDLIESLKAMWEAYADKAGIRMTDAAQGRTASTGLLKTPIVRTGTA